MAEKINIPYGKQFIDEEDVAAVVASLKSDYLTTGPKVAEFEKMLGNYIGAKHSIAVNSGTSALDIAIGALELDPGSEVITTPFTFVASSNCILYNNCKPVFSDIDRKTYNIDPAEIKKKITKKTKAIVYVDYSGQPCEIDEIGELAEGKGIHLIEDACHALGAKYKGKMIGTFADMTVFSFHPVKHITTAEGGAITTENEELYSKLKLLRNHGIDRTPSERAGYVYDMKMLGRNYRITDIQCALGISQMKKLDRFVTRRKEIARQYNEALSSVPEITTPYEAPNTESSWHLYTILLNGNISRDRIFENMRKRGIGVNVHYIPTYKFTYYKAHFSFKESEYPNTEHVSSRILSLPLYYGMSNEDVQMVVRALKDSIDELKGKTE